MAEIFHDEPLGAALSAGVAGRRVHTTARGIPYLLDLLERGPRLLVVRSPGQQVSDALGELAVDEGEMLYLGPRVYYSPLSPCERRVLQHLAQGATNPEIAAAVGCSVHTVKAHVRTVLRKMKVADRREATAVYWGHSPDPLAEEARAWLEGLPGGGARNPSPQEG